MVHASLSVEGMLGTRLDALNCSMQAFSNITGIPKSTISHTLAGNRSFSESEKANIEDCLNEMAALQLEIHQKTKSAVGIDWSAQQTADTIAVRKIAHYLELIDGDHSLEQTAQQLSDRTPILSAQPEAKE